MSGLVPRRTRYSPITMGIGSHFVHMAQLKVSGGEISVSAKAFAPIETDVDAALAIERAIRSCLNAADFRGHRAAICLKGDDIFVQHQRLHLDPNVDAISRIREECRRNVAFDVDHAEVRYIATGKVYERSEMRNELILMIANREVIDHYIAILDRLGLVAVTIGAESLALMKALLRFPPPGYMLKGVAGFMNIAASKVELLVIRNGQLAFTRSLPMGGEMFTRAIVEKLEIDVPSAERLKRAICTGEEINETLRSAVVSAFRPVMEGMCAEILSCFRYFSSIFNRETVNRLIIAGEEVGGIVTPQFVMSQLGMPVLPWNTSVLSGYGSDATRDSDSSFAPIVGLAIDILEPNDLSVDFMPEDVVFERLQKKSMIMRTVSMLLLLFLLGTLHFITFKRRQNLSEVLDLVDSRLNLIEMKKDVIEGLKKEESAMKEDLMLLNSVKPEIRASRVLADVALSSGDGITLRHVTMQTVSPEPIIVPGEPGEEERTEVSASYFLIRVEGLARSSLDVTDFKHQLNSTESFSMIRNEGYEDEVVGEGRFKRFRLSLTVGGDPYEVF
jgi:Tfp pilus assembly PilM family ATPase